MRRFFLFIALIIGLFMSVPLASAKNMVDSQTDSLLKSHKLVYIDGRPADGEMAAYVDSVREQISRFYYDQFRHFSDPAAPYFLFMSKDAQLAMGIGGAVRMRAYYDWGGAMPTPKEGCWKTKFFSRRSCT